VAPPTAQIVPLTKRANSPQDVLHSKIVYGLPWAIGGHGSSAAYRVLGMQMSKVGTHVPASVDPSVSMHTDPLPPSLVSLESLLLLPREPSTPMVVSSAPSFDPPLLD
jgi:hypothetical protein